MRFEGRLKSWNDERGFGFIEPAVGGEEIFVHIKSLPAGSGRPVVGLLSSFEVELGSQGKKRAKSVHFVRPSKQAPGRRAGQTARWTPARRLVLPCFFCIYVFVAWRWRVSPWVAVAYVVASLLAIVFYAIDKSAARRAGWRISEAALHWLGILGGWPGALLAQQLLRHKSSKPEFVAKYWATVVVNITGFVVVHSPVASRLFA
ncbi:MAG: cold shock and DUF1294 domain-containing protein [Rhodoferax sp.]|nr:cold shock and DUF1294 domain-containing protein [Rhodoferax sp.]